MSIVNNKVLFDYSVSQFDYLKEQLVQPCVRTSYNDLAGSVWTTLIFLPVVSVCERAYSEEQKFLSFV